jgi:Zn-dependent M28 family amino/carboxypeptidase
MGSMIHAQNCSQKKENISLMISLDMIGYGSTFVKQNYPFKYMKETYPQKANFLSVVSLPSSAKYTYLWKKHYNEFSKKKMYEFVAPASINGIHESDHYSFFKHGYPSILITDTGYYRSKFYHTEKDIPSKINYGFLANNIIAISKTLHEIANFDKILEETS